MPRDATRRLETPPRRNFDANFDDFDMNFGSFLVSLCDGAREYRLQRHFVRFFVKRRKSAKIENMRLDT